MSETLPKCKKCGRPLEVIDENHTNVFSWSWNEEKKRYEPLHSDNVGEQSDYVCGFCGEPIDDEAYKFFEEHLW